MLEAYQAFGDYESMMELVQSMICHVAQRVLGTLKIIHPPTMIGAKVGEAALEAGKQAYDVARMIDKLHKENEPRPYQREIDLTPPWRRVKYRELVQERAGEDWFQISPAARRQRAESLGAEIGKEYEDFEVTQAVFEKLIEPTLINPTFVTHAPKELIPLAKLSLDDPTTVEVFECCINGQEIAPAYTEQNDPIEQRERLEHQAGGEQQKLDEDFLVALEHGMPPAGGMGMGIDRLCMMLLGQESIRDVILFPQLKPK
jgi:lysyl-tRNA synthetase, class II